MYLGMYVPTYTGAGVESPITTYVFSETLAGNDALRTFPGNLGIDLGIELGIDFAATVTVDH